MQEISFHRDILPLRDKLFRLALRITCNRMEAEDVVQDTMMRVWNRRDEWSAYSSIEAFCLTVVRNLAIDRSERMDARTVVLPPEAEQTPDTSTPYDELTGNDYRTLLHRLIAALPEQQRTLVQLRDIEGMTYREVAGATGMTEEQVKAHLFKARQKIKKQFIDIDNYGL